jgi:hypothetical protein
MFYVLSDFDFNFAVDTGTVKNEIKVGYDIEHIEMCFAHYVDSANNLLSYNRATRIPNAQNHRYTARIYAIRTICALSLGIPQNRMHEVPAIQPIVKRSTRDPISILDPDLHPICRIGEPIFNQSTSNRYERFRRFLTNLRPIRVIVRAVLYRPSTDLNNRS